MIWMLVTDSAATLHCVLAADTHTYHQVGPRGANMPCVNPLAAHLGIWLELIGSVWWVVVDDSASLVGDGSASPQSGLFMGALF
jgi:hypothetical protein